MSLFLRLVVLALGLTLSEGKRNAAKTKILRTYIKLFLSFSLCNLLMINLGSHL